MTTATVTAPTAATLVPYRFSVDDYDELIASGFFDDKGRFELIEGQVIPQMPRNPTHDNTLDPLTKSLLFLAPPGWRVRNQSGITLSASVPEPDICVARGDLATFAARRPEPTDIALLAEVSDSTLDTDRGVKVPLYAGEGILEYWIVNIPERRVEVYSQPSGPAAAPAYASRQICCRGSSVPLILSGITVAHLLVDHLFP